MVRLGELVRDVQASLAPQLIAQGVQTAVDVPVGQSVLVDHDMLRRAILNLMLNALDAMPQGGDLIITSVDGPEGIELEIADSGQGYTHKADCRHGVDLCATSAGCAVYER